MARETKTIRVMGGLILSILIAGCLGSSEKVLEPEQQFGQRADNASADGRTTTVIQPQSDDLEYRYFPAIFSTITVRVAPRTPENESDGVPVELLIKGAFPDSCTELNDVSQTRAGSIVNITLEMRRPKGRVCASVLRPYRFYLGLDGTFGTGAYVVKLNGRSRPFEVRESIGQ